MTFRTKVIVGVGVGLGLGLGLVLVLILVLLGGKPTTTTTPTPIPTQYTQTIYTAGNGTATGAGTYDEGTVVLISATPASGWAFINWTGDVANPNSATTTVTMDASKTITANFEVPAVTATLTIAVNGSGWTTPVVGEHEYSEDEVVTITATPGWVWAFINWTGDVANPNSATTTVTMDANKTITANFEELFYPPDTNTP